jgi:predicted ATPase
MASTEMIAAVAGGKPLPDEVLAQIWAKTEGVPLFVEELTKPCWNPGCSRIVATATS